MTEEVRDPEGQMAAGGAVSYIFKKDARPPVSPPPPPPVEFGRGFDNPPLG